MKKTFLSVLMFVATFLGVMAQQGLTPLPLMPGVKTGVLPNGLTYYVMHNSEPKDRANFYIAQKVGSSLETPDQLGLAHFLEHMAFNGTTHYPGKAMLNYLQNKGIRFGDDINAVTGFDETIYNINNVPTTDKALMDSVLLVIRDWCDGIALEESEIDAERGVIQEEWRQRNDAGIRMYKEILPQLYEEYQYEQLPIGLMEVVMNFKPEVLREYYKKWYRPDQQGIFVVGDFDADEMEKKVIDLFSTVVMPENAAPREYPVISNNEKPLYITFQDPETPNAMVTISFKFDKTPWEMRNSVEAYVQDVLLEQVLSSMVNTRLSEYSQQPDCPYAFAFMRIGNYYVSKGKGALSVYVVPKSDFESAVAGAMGVVARAFKTGFTPSEYERATTEILASYEAHFNERNKRDNADIAAELIRSFTDNEPAPGAEVELQLAQMVYQQMLNNEAVSQIASQLLTPNNQVIVLQQPKTEGSTFPAEAEFVANLENVLNAQYEAYVDEVITEPLIAKMRKPGKIKKETKGEWGTTEMTLSNGAKVIVKPTDFTDDQIMMQAFRLGGKRAYDKSQANEVLMLGDAVELSKLGTFDNLKLRKYLAGKRASLSFAIGNYTDYFSGMSTVKDLPTLMELIYATFTDLQPDAETYGVTVDRSLAFLANEEKKPESVFNKRIALTQYGNNPLQYPQSTEVIKNANYDSMLKMAREAMANAADYTFIFVGNVDAATLRPLLEKYIASLPSKGKPRKMKEVSNIDMVSGQVVEEWDFPMETPSVFVYDVYGGNNVDYTMENDAMIPMIGEILSNIYTATLREEEGGTYGASVGSYLNPNNGRWQLAYMFQTNADQKQALIDRADKEWKKLLSEGANAEDFNKVRQAAIKQLEIQERTNDFWVSNLLTSQRGIPNTVDGRKAFLEGLTLEKFNEFMRSLYDGTNRVQVIMNGVENK
ncbi:MAG: insulinase family protein [Muribaculaceae bacterium]|nr:insulinase family protein [Muribaculaceae bacterium]